MSDTRTTTLQIKAETSGFRNGLRTARKGLQDFNKEVQKSAAKRQAINDLGSGFGKVGLLAAAGAAVAIRAYANFDQAMSAVKATGDDARRSQIALRQAAIDAGQATQFNATESAGAIENLAKAGVSAADILGGGLKGSLDLAAAGGLDVASAASIAAIALTQFKLKGEDVPHVADLLAAGAGKANGEVTDLAAALNQSGLVAAQMGLSIEETTGSLAAFASAGLLGSDAGTSLKTMLLRLQNPAKESADLMKKLGINAYDAQGNFVGMADLSGQLAKAFDGQKQSTRDAAMAQIFGSDAIRAANVLYNEGAKGIDGWTKKVNDAGYASETAATKMDNLKGDWEKLTGSLETALIGTGEGADGPLRGLLQDVTGLIDAFNGLPAPVKSGALQIAALTAVVGLSGFAASRAITGYANLKNTFSDLGMRAEGANKKMLLLRGGALAGGLALTSFSDDIGKSNKTLGDFAGYAGAIGTGFAIAGPWGAAIGGGGRLLGEFASASQEAANAQLALDSAGKEVAATLDRQTGAITALTKATAAKKLADQGVLKIAREMGISQADVLDATLGNERALKKVTKASEEWADALVRSGDYTEDEEAKLRAFQDSIGATADAIGKEKVAILDAAAAMGLIPDAIVTEISAPGFEATRGNILDLAAKYKLTPKQVTTLMKALDMASPDIKKVLDAIRNLDKAEAKPKVNLLDGLTPKGRQLLGLMGVLDDADANPNVTLSGWENARDGANAVTYAMNNIPPSASSTITLTRTTIYETKHKEYKIATGGAIHGPGTGTSDSIPAMVSNGEHMMTAAEVQAAGGHGAIYAMRAQILKGNRPRFAVGGEVSTTPPSRARRAARSRQMASAGASSGNSASSATYTASLVGAQVVVDGDGLMTFVDGRVEIGIAGNSRHSAAASRRKTKK